MTTHAATPFYRSHYTGYFTLKIKCLRQQNKEKRGIFPLFSKMVPLTTLNLKKVKAALACRASILERLDKGKLSINKPERKYPYDEDTKIVKELRVKQKFLTMDEQAEVENLYRKGMTMTAIAKCYGCHCSTIGRILRRRNVSIRKP